MVDSKEYIEKESLLQALEEVGGCDAPLDSWADGWDKGISEAIKLTEEQPVADVVEVRHGKWDYEISDVGWTDYSCSVCRNIITVEGQDEDLYSYCPYCGAKMDGKVGADNA